MFTKLLTSLSQGSIKVLIKNSITSKELVYPWTRVAEVAREHGWHPAKSLDSDENFKPEHKLFCRKFRFVAIYAIFGDLWARKCLFGSKTAYLGQEVHYIHGIYCIFY